MGRLKSLANHAPVIFSVHFTPGEMVDKQVFTADRDYEILSITEVHVAAGNASSTMDVEKCASGTAPASGTDVVDAAFLLDSTDDTPVEKNRSNGGILTLPTALLAKSDSLAVDITGTVTNYEGVVTIVLKPHRPAKETY